MHLRVCLRIGSRVPPPCKYVAIQWSVGVSESATDFLLGLIGKCPCPLRLRDLTGTDIAGELIPNVWGEPTSSLILPVLTECLCLAESTYTNGRADEGKGVAQIHPISWERPPE